MSCPVDAKVWLGTERTYSLSYSSRTITIKFCKVLGSGTEATVFECETNAKDSGGRCAVKLAHEYAARDICALATDHNTLAKLQLGRHEKREVLEKQLVPRLYSYDLLRDKAANAVLIPMELLGPSLAQVAEQVQLSHAQLARIARQLETADQTFHDDLEAIGFVIYSLARMDLPWANADEKHTLRLKVDFRKQLLAARTVSPVQRAMHDYFTLLQQQRRCDGGAVDYSALARAFEQLTAGEDSKVGNLSSDAPPEGKVAAEAAGASAFAHVAMGDQPEPPESETKEQAESRRSRKRQRSLSPVARTDSIGEASESDQEKDEEEEDDKAEAKRKGKVVAKAKNRRKRRRTN